MKNVEEDDGSTYVYLDFNGKLSCDLFQNDVFLRIANLHNENPLVQVNDSLFKGTYEQSMGTNLYFEETGNSYSGNVFVRKSPINLSYFQKSTKVLNLHQVKIPHAKAKIQNEVKNINYKLNWDYQVLLEKFENGSLQIEDITSGEEPVEQEIQEEISNIDNFVSNIPDPENDTDLNVHFENNLKNSTAVKILEKEYENLNVLARRPVKRVVSPELVSDPDEKYSEAYMYHNILKQILKPRDGFTSEVLQVDENTLSDCVDVERCVLFGVISKSSQFPRLLSKEEKEKLLSLDNFDNLSLAARYYVLQNIVSNLEEQMLILDDKKRQEKDEFGRRPLETLDIYRKLKEAVGKRLQEIKMATNE